MRAFIGILLALVVSIAYGETLNGRVVGVIDGDTVDVLSDRALTRVRVAGIDAPEKRQPYGMAAKRLMSDLVMGKDVTVEYSKQDRYQRIVGVVSVGEVDAGLELIRSGLAWHYKKYEREQQDDARRTYSEAELQARSIRSGLWQQSAPTPPWDWRRQSVTPK